MSEAEEKSKEVEEVLDVAQEDTSGSVALKNSTDAAEAPSKGLNLSEVELSEDERIKLKKYFDEALIEQQEDLEDGKVAETEGINDAAEDENRDKEKEAEKGSTASDSCSEVPEGLDKQHFVDLVKMILIEIGMKNKPTQADLGKAFVDFDSNKGGTVDFEEFLELFTRVKQGKVNGLGAGPIEQLWQAIVKPKKKDPKMHHVVTITIHFPEESKNSFIRTDDGERPQRLVDALQEGLGYYYRDRIHCIDLAKNFWSRITSCIPLSFCRMLSRRKLRCVPETAQFDIRHVIFTNKKDIFGFQVSKNDTFTAEEAQNIHQICDSFASSYLVIMTMKNNTIVKAPSLNKFHHKLFC